jgi:hypothetical protein
MTRFNTSAKISTAFVKKGLALAVVTTLVSGCMSDVGSVGGGIVSQQNFQPVQASQFADATKGCRDIQAEVAQVDQAIMQVERKIQGANTTQSAFGLLSSFGSFNSNQQALAGFGQSQTSSQVYRLEDTKRSYQKRRDTLFRGFVNKGCSVG